MTCLLSALRFHGLTTQASSEVWPAVGPKDRASRPDGVRLPIVFKASATLTAALETCEIPAARVRETYRDRFAT